MSTVSKPSIKSSKILIVDDTPVSLQLLIDLLKKNDYIVSASLNGPAALIKARQERPDLILLDIMMPEMDGYEVCQSLKADETTRDIPVIFISALHETVDKIKGFQLGGVDYITKPFQIEEVLARIETHLALQQLRQQLEDQNSRLQQEIIERKRQEERLRLSEAKYRLLAEHSSDAVALFTNREVAYISPSYQNICGYSPDDVTGYHLDDILSLIHPDDVDHILDLLRQGTRDKLSAQKYSFRIKHKRGHYVWVEDVIKREFDKNGDLLRAIINTRDITDRKQIEEALRESEARYRIISEVISNIAYVYDVDVDGSLVRVWATEGAAKQVTGYSYDEIDEMGGWMGLIHPDDLPRVLQHDDRLKSGQTSVVEYRIMTKTGKTRWIRDFARPEREDQQKRVSCIYGGCQDITQQKRLEEQLNQSQKMEAIGHLAGGVAHHFNNLLTTIIGYVDLSATELPANHPVIRDLQIIKRTAQRAATLTRQLLTFTRKQILQPKIINLNDIILSTQSMLRQLITESVELDPSLTPDLGQVKIDAGQFEQLLVNLVVNARDAMPSGGRLTLQTRNVIVDFSNANQYADIPPGDYVQLTVTDTGTGITEEVKARIFEPFFTTKEVGQGTGLGLSTCFGIVKQHEGYITVDSRPGSGTTFEVYFPRFEEQPVHSGIERTDGLPKGIETILLVEDETNVRDLICRVLRRQGYNVLEATDGVDALQTIEKRSVTNLDLLLADVVMPTMGGIELAAKLTAKYPKLRVLLISGYPEQIASQQDILEQSIAFLSKPFSPAKLTQSIRSVLDTPQESQPPHNLTEVR